MKKHAEIHRLIQNSNDCFDGKPWYGTSVINILQGIPFTHVNSTPPGFKKSIAVILYHMVSWREFTLAKLKGKADFKIPEDSPLNWNFEPVPDAAVWEQLIEKLRSTQKEFISHLQGMAHADLDKKVPGSIYTFDYLIRGIIQHDTFHLGQIALLKRALASDVNSGS